MKNLTVQDMELFAECKKWDKCNRYLNGPTTFRCSIYESGSAGNSTRCPCGGMKTFGRNWAPTNYKEEDIATQAKTLFDWHQMENPQPEWVKAYRSIHC